MAIAGTLASTRSLLGLSHVFPQSSILYGPRSGNASSAFPGGTRSVQAAPATVTKTVRRVITSSVLNMVRLLCLDTLHNAALSCHVLKPTDASAHVTKCSIGCRLSITWKVIRAGHGRGGSNRLQPFLRAL